MDDPIADFKEWYLQRPIVTRVFLTISTIMAVLMTLGVIDVYMLYYTFAETFYTFNLWRPLTSLLFLGELNFSFLFQAYFAYFALVSAERDLFQRSKFADYLTLLVYLFVMMVISGSIFDIYFLSDGFLFALIYIWCKLKPFQVITFLFGISLTSGYFPWVYLGFTVLMKQPFVSLVIGFLIAHLYLYIKGSLFHKFGKDFLPTPSLLKSLAKIYLDWQDRRRPQQNIQGEMNEDDDNLYN